MPVIDGLEAAFELDDVNDSHGSNHLTNNNVVTFVPGKVGNAASFASASSQSLSIVDNASLSMGDIDFSVQLWLRASVLGVVRTVLAKDDDSQREYGFYHDAGVALKFYVFGTGGQFAEVGTTDISIDTWYHVVGYHDSVNDQIGIIIDAGSPVTASHTFGVRDGAAPFRIGALGNGSSFFDGLIDQVYVAKRLWTIPEITWFFNDGNGRSYAEVLAGMGGDPAQGGHIVAFQLPNGQIITRRF